jgi:hypothetical protein
MTKEKHICKHCGGEIPPTGYNHEKKFCSDKCRSEYHNSKRKKVKKCLNCGAETTKKYCCKECGVKYRNRARRKESIQKREAIENKLSW